MAKEEAVAETRKAVAEWDKDLDYIQRLNTFIGAIERGADMNRLSIYLPSGHSLGVPTPIVERWRNAAIDLARSEIHLATERMKALEIPAA